MIILGINAYHGDAAAAIIEDGKLVAAVEEERFNRIKHCAGFPGLAAAWCLAEAGLKPDDLDHVAIGRKPRANFGAKLHRTLRHRPGVRFVRERLVNAARIASARDAVADALGVE